ncbi:hypothetical protein L596_006235 [Steinernema carpocapsae]|uniref:Uncharacterized protein n=1 Tax=Steinernema carpocapsae TaxID=34508 RepID=A0A4U8V312_STECR|nr:hypothetical protein L596_006235 [Steinernema carpocapsae]
MTICCPSASAAAGKCFGQRKQIYAFALRFSGGASRSLSVLCYLCFCCPLLRLILHLTTREQLQLIGLAERELYEIRSTRALMLLHCLRTVLGYFLTFLLMLTFRLM